MESRGTQHNSVKTDLLDHLLNELSHCREADDVIDSIIINKRFGDFLQNYLNAIGCSKSQFTRALDLIPEFTDAILEGSFPLSEIDDLFLVELADFIEQDVEILRAILKRDRVRKPAPAQPKSAPTPAQPAKSNTKPLNSPLDFLRGLQTNSSRAAT